MGLARFNNFSIVVIGMHDVPFGIGQQRTRLGAMMLFGQQRCVGLRLTLSHAGKFDPSHRQQQANDHQHHDQNQP